MGSSLALMAILRSRVIVIVVLLVQGARQNSQVQFAVAGGRTDTCLYRGADFGHQLATAQVTHAAG